VTFQGNQGGGAGYGQPAVRPAVQVQGAYLTQAFFWMFAGLLLTAAVAAAVQLNQTLLEFAANNFMILFIAQIGLVIAISWGIRRIGAVAALGLFFVYAASLGVTIGLIVSAYTTASVVTAFLSAGAMFGGAALYGYTTKRNLTSIGGFMSMAVLGLIVAMVVNLFLGSSPLTWIISLVGVVLFTVLTAYHVQKISNGELVLATGSSEKAAVIGALSLYLDFINIFLFLLNLLGGRR
jgi:FtsH-binding integral membrane protein